MTPDASSPLVCRLPDDSRIKVIGLGGIGCVLLPYLAGRRRSARYLLLGEPFGAEEALAIGIASHVVPAGRLERELESIVAALLAKPAEALRATQRLLRHGESPAILERMELESQTFAERLESDEVKQAIESFFAARAKA